MIMTPDATSVAFREFIDQVHAPVIMQIVPALNSGGVEQGVIDLNAAIVKAGGHSIVVSSGGARVREIVKAGGTHITLPVHSPPEENHQELQCGYRARLQPRPGLERWSCSAGHVCQICNQRPFSP